jgi:hypothetical protein
LAAGGEHHQGRENVQAESAPRRRRLHSPRHTQRLSRKPSADKDENRSDAAGDRDHGVALEVVVDDVAFPGEEQGEEHDDCAPNGFAGEDGFGIQGRAFQVNKIS